MYYSKLLKCTIDIDKINDYQINTRPPKIRKILPNTLGTIDVIFVSNTNIEVKSRTISDIQLHEYYKMLDSIELELEQLFKNKIVNRS